MKEKEERGKVEREVEREMIIERGLRKNEE